MRKRSLLASLATAALFGVPEGSKTVCGRAVLNSPTLHILEISADDKTVLEWNHFSIARDESVRFNLPDVDAAILNRVVGGSPTALMGLLESNGSVYLINPNGILIGADAVVNTGGFLASTLDVSNQDFIKGDLLNFQGQSHHSISHLGTIFCPEGDVFLLGYRIENEGVISALTGTVGIGAAEHVLLTPREDQKLAISVSASSVKEGVGIAQNGLIEAVQAELKADGNPYAYAIQNSGEIDARTVDEFEGRVYLVAAGGHATSSGVIHSPGGAVRILGEYVSLTGNASIDVSDIHGGGTVLLGGDYQGGNPEVMRARATLVESGVKIYADALSSGDGGKIVVWSDEATGFQGEAFARGGSLRGDGGLVEVSSKNQLEFLGFVNTLAENGTAGLLLLDPPDINISAAPTSANITFGGACGALFYCTTAVAPNPANVFIGPGAGSILTNLAAGNVTVNSNTAIAGTNGDITFLSPLTWTGALAGVRTFTVSAFRNIVVNSPVTNTTTVNAGNIILTAGTGGPGSITVNSPISFGVASLGALTMSANNGITVNADITIANNTTTALTATGGSISIFGRLINTLAGPITITSAGNISVGSSTLLVPSQVGSFQGAVTLNMTGAAGDLQVLGGTALGAFAQIGFDSGTPITSTISIVNVPRNLVINGGTANNCYAVIGHGNATGANTGTRTAGISMPNGITGTIGGNVLIQGGINGINSFAQIGHIRGSGAPGVAVNGVIDMRFITGTLSLIGGNLTGSYAQIGHGGREANSADTYIGAISVNATGAISLSGGIADQTFAAIGHTAYQNGAAAVTISSTPFSCTSLSDISLRANGFSEALIGGRVVGLGGGTGTISIPTITVSTGGAGNLTLQGAIPSTAANDVFIGALATTGVGSLSNAGSAGSALSITVGNDFFMEAGSTGASTATFALLTNGNNSPIGGPFSTSVIVGGDSTIQGGSNQAGILNIQGTVGVTSLSFTTTGILNLISQQTAPSLGTAFVLNTGNGTTTVSAGEILMRGFAGGPTASIQNTLNSTLTVTSATDLTLDPNAFINLAAPGAASLSANALGGDLTLRDNSFIRNQGTGSVTANATGNAFIESGPTGASFISGNTIPAPTYGGNLVMRGVFPAAPASLLATATPMVVTAGGSVLLDPNAFITASGGAGVMSIGATTGNISVQNGSRIQNLGTGPMSLTTAGDLIIDGETATTTPTSIESSGSLTGTIGQNLLVQGGLNGSSGLLSSTGALSAIATGNISLLSGASGAADITSTGGSVFISSGGNLFLSAAQSQASIQSSLSTFTTTITGSMTLSAVGPTGAAFVSGSTGGTATANSITLMGFSPLIQSFIQSSAGILTVTSATNLILDPGAHINLLGGAGTLTATATAGDILIFDSSSIFNGGLGATTVSAGGTIDILGGVNGAASITGSGGTIGVTTGSSLNLLSAAGGAASITNGGSISIASGANISLGGTGTQASILTTGGDIQAIAQNNISIRDDAFIRNNGAGNIILVVDQQAPLSPAVGPGRFILDPAASVGRAGGGPLRIFTATPTQNLVFGTLNALAVTTGGPSSATEQYSTYFSTFGGGFGIPYTLFYKTTGSSTPSGGGGVSAVIIPGTFYFISYLAAEMSNNLKRLDEYLWLPDWSTCQKTEKKRRIPRTSSDVLDCEKRPVIIKKLDMYPMNPNYL